MHSIAAKAVCFGEVLSKEYKEYASQVVKNAQRLSEVLMASGIELVSGGTDNHLLLLDLRPLNMTGKEAEAILQSVGIVVNKNTIPYDPEKPLVTSGVRMGTPVLTSRGMKEEEMEEIGGLISWVLKKPAEKTLSAASSRVKELAGKFPLR